VRLDARVEVLGAAREVERPAGAEPSDGALELLRRIASPREVGRGREGEEDERRRERDGASRRRQSFGSVTRCSFPAATEVSFCVRPPGHEISHASTSAASPSPKKSVGVLCER